MTLWRKIGLIFAPDRSLPWMKSHAALPVPLHLRGDRWRVYFASRDGANCSHIGYFEIDVGTPDRVLAVSPEPVLRPGPIGHFDDHGIYAASIARNGDDLHMYTIGWNPGARAPLFYASIGLAISRDGGKTFEKHGRAPIMARSEHDPALVTSPFVVRDGDLWRMWYVSGDAWSEIDGALSSSYHIKYAHSVDGIVWQRDGLVCIGPADHQERNIARTCVLREPNGWRAWFSSSRGQGYRIGTATSADGLTWQRGPTPVGLEPSAVGWDSEAMAYPHVVRHAGRLLMFYNGNGFGRDGVGLAVADDLV